MTTLSPEQIVFERILVPTDFSEISERAVEYAKRIAKRFDSQIFLTYVSQPINPITPPETAWFDQESASEKLQEQLEENGAALRSEGFRAESISMTGSVQDEVLSLIKRHQIDLVVLGTHGKSGIERLLFGSDAERVLRHVPCPALSLGPAVPLATGRVWTPKRVVCATALDPESAWIAAYALRLAHQFEAQFVLFHVGGPKDLRQDHDWKRFEEAVREHLPGDLGRDLSLRTLLSDEKPGVGIVDFVKKQNADLIVMGAKTASTIATHLVKGVAPEVLAKVSCPVLVLHHAHPV